MWKKNNPGRSGMEARPRDVSGLSGVRRPLPGGPVTRGGAATQPPSAPRTDAKAASDACANARPDAGTGAETGSKPASVPQSGAASPLAAALGRAGQYPRQEGPPGPPPPPHGSATARPDPRPESGATPGVHPGGEPRPLVVFTGRGGPYCILLIKTVICSLLTVGVYSFWGRTEMRRYLWSNTQVLGEPLEYTGTGKELLLGFLIVLPFFILFSFLAALAAASVPVAGGLLFYLALAGCYEYAAYRALRYRLTRTRWRGIRGNLDGSAGIYAARALALWAGALLTCGLLLPYATAKRLEMKLGNIRIGNSRLAFTARAWGLYKVFFLTLLPPALAFAALLFTLGARFILYGQAHASHEIMLWLVPCALWMSAAWFFYRAALFRWLCSGVSFAGMHFGSTLSGWRYLRTQIGNGLMLLLSYGVALAWVIIRDLRVRLDSVVFTGTPDFAGILQDAGDAPETGEGLLDAFDVDIGL